MAKATSMGYNLIDLTHERIMGSSHSLNVLRKLAMTRDNEYSVVQILFVGMDDYFYPQFKTKVVGGILPPKFSADGKWEWITDRHVTYDILKNGTLKR